MLTLHFSLPDNRNLVDLVVSYFQYYICDNLLLKQTDLIRYMVDSLIDGTDSIFDGITDFDI